MPDGKIFSKKQGLETNVSIKCYAIPFSEFFGFLESSVISLSYLFPFIGQV